MYAIIETGGKQYRVVEGETIAVEKLPQQQGEQVVFERVLHLSTDSGAKVGRPYLQGCTVVGTVMAHEKAKKVTIVKYKSRKNYRRERGHRQWFTLVKIEKIRTGEA
ncbi:MAG: 50S ribosomal protein L21 [Pseudothermotoga sp.]